MTTHPGNGASIHDLGPLVSTHVDRVGLAARQAQAATRAQTLTAPSDPRIDAAPVRRLWSLPESEWWGIERADLIGSWAALSPCRRYRYGLGRELPRTINTVPGRRCVFVMLNPSTADAAIDDPTVRRCVGFAAREGSERLVVVNLFAWRATSPRELTTVGDPIGPGNQEALETAVDGDQVLVIGAWGSSIPAGQGDYVSAVADGLCRIGGRRLGALTSSGQPRHPLYLRADVPLVGLGE